MNPGTVILTDQGGPLINRILGIRWSHALVWLEGVYYEATFPRVRRSTHWKGHKSLVLPPLPGLDEAAMVRYANSQLGRIYQFRGYFVPRRYGKTRGIYCSQYVNDVLRAGGADLPYRAGYSPDTLLREIRKLAGQT